MFWVFTKWKLINNPTTNRKITKRSIWPSIIFSNNGESSEINSTQAANLSALDMRIYDLEKDIKNLTGNIEELYFTLEDLVLKLDNYEQQLTSIDGKISNIINSNNSEK